MALVAASCHRTVTDGLLDGARRGRADAGITAARLLEVPGGSEPTAAATRFARQRVVVAVRDVPPRSHALPAFGR